MKKYIILLATYILAACTPDMKEAELRPVISADDINIIVTPTSVENVYEFTSNVTGLLLGWDLGNGLQVSGPKATGTYPFKGDYTITLTVLDQGGMVSKTTPLKLKNDNYELIKDPLFDMISGGLDAVEGKTWVMDSTSNGHLIVGNVLETETWWSAPALDKQGWGMYDDELTFILKGAKNIYNNHGDSYVNTDALNEAIARGATVINKDGDSKVAYTQKADWTWSIVKDNGKNYLVFPAGQGFAIYWTKETHKYEIREITNDFMHLIVDYGSLKWHVKLIRKGYVPPVKEKPYKSIDIECTFDNDPLPSLLTWDKGESKNFSVVSNMPVGINKSAKVGMYERGTNEWCALTADLPVNLDLTTRNKFKLKVFFPSENKYDPAEGDALNQYFNKTITMRLQDGEIAEPWTVQADVTLPVTVFGQWLEFEFDFSAFKDSKKFDRIMLQFGGEPKFVDGTFFFDDLILL